MQINIFHFIMCLIQKFTKNCTNFQLCDYCILSFTSKCIGIFYFHFPTRAYEYWIHIFSYAIIWIFFQYWSIKNNFLEKIFCVYIGFNICIRKLPGWWLLLFLMLFHQYFWTNTIVGSIVPNSITNDIFRIVAFFICGQCTLYRTYFRFYTYWIPN